MLCDQKMLPFGNLDKLAKDGNNLEDDAYEEVNVKYIALNRVNVFYTE